MKTPGTVVLIIVVSLLFADGILVADAVLEGTQHRAAVIYALIALWWVPFAGLAIHRRQDHRQESPAGE